MEEKLPEKVCYEMPTEKMSSHLKPLYVGAHFDGVPVSKVLVDTGATVHILPASIMRKLKKGSDELILTETTINGFVGDTTTSKGIIPLQVRVGQKVRMTTFFVVETTEIVQANVMEAKFYEDDIGPLYFTGPDRNGRPTGVSAQKLIDLG
ncbi:unnamed protein product, partial [Prunus brigantina]